MRFSLVIPCYNEAANLPLLLERCNDLHRNPLIEIIFVDNGSTDNSKKILRGLLTRYPQFKTITVKKNRGYGFGILSGLKVARGEILGWTHADMQTDPLDIIRGLKLFDKYGEDIFVKGRRYGRPIMDVFFTLGMSIFETFLLSRIMWDINAQPTLLSRRFFQTWENPPDDFSLDLYAYYRAKHSGRRVYRFPVKFGERVHGLSHWNINWREKRKFIWRTISYSFRMKSRNIK